ncbi:MAG: hypothetical protein HC819_23635 [Cyclobacteriaceae bacterium]|nr:hypothetical protein [Cyclobacteriaceae bacterium]
MKFSLLFAAFLFFTISGCKRGDTSWRYLIRPLSSTTYLDDEENADFTKEYGAKILSKKQCRDSLAFQCFEVDVMLPKDTTNYLILMSVWLPGMMEIEGVPKAIVNVGFYPHNDSLNAISAKRWVYYKGIKD